MVSDSRGPGEAGPAASRAIRLIALLSVLATIYGWKLFLFLTDDAFIAFRYVSNSLAGRGLVWNPAPFAPVEGYTSFLWVVLLREVWRFAGVEPPQAANVLSLLFGIGTLLLALRLVTRLVLPPKLARWRPLLVGGVALGIVTNRTFLAWLSSGLETALFNFLFTWWVCEALSASGRERPAWVARLSIAASLTALCRPDGLLVVAATVVVWALEWSPASLPRALAASPLVLVPVHVAWRWITYGDWVPNTYRAKYSGAWPQSGARYFASFVVEYGVWWWFLVVLLWAARAPWRTMTLDRHTLARAVPIAVLVAHLAYYTLIIGCDLFEYRVYSHLIPLLFVSAVWLAIRVTDRIGAVAVLVATFLLVSWPIPWVHWWATRDIQARSDTFITISEPIASRFPWPLRPVVARWDGWQDWLIRHFVCRRHQEQKVFLEEVERRLPKRDAGLAMSWGDRNVLIGASVGVPGWVLPNVALIDVYGLNDRVVALYGPQATQSEQRKMAHNRKPPTGYTECFRPNVHIKDGSLVVLPRQHPLTDAEIHDCETRDWSRPAALAGH
jgi:arabinofuranosyltransferase